MKQVLIRAGAAIVEEIPAPQVSAGSVLVAVSHSCISVGTEMAGVRSSGMPLYRRALAQPDNVKRVLEMVKDQGLRKTVDRVSGKLAAGSPTGYSAAGTVIAVGAGVEIFKVGDQVACAGAGIANHAEIIDVPVNLAAAIPDGVSTRQACTVTLGAIAMQGVRRAGPTLGETIVVVGLGVLGQLTVQFLVANGCRVIGVDPDPERLALAKSLGMECGISPVDTDYVARVTQLTDGFGADAVIVTAAGSSDEIISLAFKAARKKARVILVGDVGLDLKRADIYAKELDFLVSCSYGPGRYDANYEVGGQDYPIAYVRWTENRNMQAYLELIARGRIQIDAIVETVFPIAQAGAAFDSLKGTGRKPLSVILEYTPNEGSPQRIVRLASHRPAAGRTQVGVIGAGSFVQGMHLPNMAKLSDRFQLRGVMSRTGTTANAVATQFEAQYATTSVDELLGDAEIDMVIIATRHDLHADATLRSLEAGKHVLVEKPLTLTPEGLERIEDFYRRNPNGPVLLTGFNRRFAPGVSAIRHAMVDRTSPLIVSYRLNAGHIPGDHWVHGAEGGGRNIGEACHIYDLFISLSNGEVADVAAHAISSETDHWRAQDNFAATVSFTDGSVCSLIYTALGARDYPKERMDVFGSGMVGSLDDYKTVTVHGSKARGWSAAASNKGHMDMLRQFGEDLREGRWTIPLEEQVAATRISHRVEALINPSAAWVDGSIV